MNIVFRIRHLTSTGVVDRIWEQWKYLVKQTNDNLEDRSKLLNSNTTYSENSTPNEKALPMNFSTPDLMAGVGFSGECRVESVTLGQALGYDRTVGAAVCWFVGVLAALLVLAAELVNHWWRSCTIKKYLNTRASNPI